jgi:hypothetical protein
MIFVCRGDELLEFYSPYEAVAFVKWTESKTGITCDVYSDYAEYWEKYGFKKIIKTAETT